MIPGQAFDEKGGRIGVGDKFYDKFVQKLSITGTPSFVLGLAGDDSNSFYATKVLQGAVPLPQFEQAIEALLAE